MAAVGGRHRTDWRDTHTRTDWRDTHTGRDRGLAGHPHGPGRGDWREGLAGHPHCAGRGTGLAGHQGGTPIPRTGGTPTPRTGGTPTGRATAHSDDRGLAGRILISAIGLAVGWRKWQLSEAATVPAPKIEVPDGGCWS